MGWFSCTVMGGDPPMDAYADLIDMCGVSYSDILDEAIDNDRDVDLTKIKANLHSHLTELVTLCESYDGDYKNISFQVLGVVLMEAGVVIPDSIKRKIINGAKNDEWAQSDGERRSYMEVFIDQIVKYEGNPTSVAYEGLFDKIAKALL